MKKSKNKIVFILLVLIVVGGGVGYALYTQKFKADDGSGELSLFTVKQGPLTISIVEAATIKARDVEIIKSQVEGNTTVLWVIAEATKVKKGEKLIVLDASELNDDRDKQDITVSNTKTAADIAIKTLEVVENKAESDITQAELTNDLAKIDLEKFVGNDEKNEDAEYTALLKELLKKTGNLYEGLKTFLSDNKINENGEFPTQLKDSLKKIDIADMEVKRTRKKYEGSIELFDDDYISETELQSDKITWNKAKLDLELQESQLYLLINFTYKRTLSELNNNVKQAGMAYIRVDLTSKADIYEAEKQLEAADKKYDQEKKILDKIDDQISKTVILAPNDGMVIYASSTKASWRSNDEPLSEGESVHEREELFHLPTADLVSAMANIHEANLDKVKLGSSVSIKVDAVPGEIFTGVVGKIAMMPDARMVYINPNLKVYKTEMYIDAKPGFDASKLRTGMGCQVEVVSAHYDDATYVPIQAVITVGNQPTVYVYENGDTKPRNVEIGEDNNRMIHIISGLARGEQVLLTPPLSKAEVKSNGKRGNGRPGMGGKPDGEGRPEGAGGKPGGMGRPEGGGKRPAADGGGKNRPGAGRRPPQGSGAPKGPGKRPENN